ncbi:aspartate/glutamate racemase family protein [uncultured Paraglaciecola sp.]|uniref:aspartate/glutamate racemase family protein n=1 Tax=uncultured Paraglaciecola sp. TaxID=1765024 RepID=UPI0030DA319D|tara:strand:- start:2294 stop:2989 length:696 start_codon:yes stop_codon:yes gene_type:complete
MKTIGMLGGMSWESTAHYYQLLNKGINEALGGLSSASIILNSVNFQDIELLQRTGNWSDTGLILGQAATAVEKAGADFIIICTNTMHKVVNEISHFTSLPILHIADATAEALCCANIKQVGLLGTAFTMEQAFYKTRIREKFSIEVTVPCEEDRAFVHKVIYQELCRGIISNESKIRFLDIINELYSQGCEGVILGCTEISLLVRQEDTDVSLYDTTAIHADAAVRLALSR